MATSAASAALSRLPTHRAIVERLSATLAPVAALNVSNDSAAHAGHSGNPTGAADAETHFSVEIVSPKFEGLRLLARHRLVYDALGNLDSLGIHALSIKAHAPGEKSAAS